MRTAHLNIPAIYEALDEKRQRLDLSWRQTAREMSVQPSTLSRMKLYSAPSAEGLVRMLEWLGHSHRRYVLYGNRR